MAEFKTPLPRLLAETLTVALNELIEVDLSEKTEQRLQVLEGRPVALCLKGLEITLIFGTKAHRLSVQALPLGQFDPNTVETTITGTPDALLAMAVPDWATSDSGVRIEGDAQCAQALEQLMRQLDPDWEALLVARAGPVIGHQLYRLLLEGFKTGKRLSSVGLDQVSRYAKEEGQWVVDRPTFKPFVDQIDQLQEAIDRLMVNAERRGLL